MINIFEESLWWYFANQPDFAAVGVFSIGTGIILFVTAQLKLRVYKQLADKLNIYT